MSLTQPSLPESEEEEDDADSDLLLNSDEDPEDLHLEDMAPAVSAKKRPAAVDDARP